MVNRLMALLGLAVVLVAIAAALLAGAASAAAETGSASDGDGTKASESKHESTPKSDPETNETTRPTGEQSSTESDSDTTDIGKQETSGSEVQKATRPAPKNNRPHTDEPASRRHPTTATSDTKDATSATEADKPAPSPNETSTTPAESSAAAEPEASAAESTPQQTAVHETETTVAMSARSTVAVTDRTTAPRAPTLVDVVGSIVLNVVMGLIHTFDGAPVLPAGSNVTVRTSTLTIAVAGGRTVEADWYFPNDDETPTRFSYFQHGLGASAPMYSYTAATLAEQTNSIVVAPSLTSNFFDADGAWLGGTPMHQAVADLFVGEREALTECQRGSGIRGDIADAVRVGRTFTRRQSGDGRRRRHGRQRQRGDRGSGRSAAPRFGGCQRHRADGPAEADRCELPPRV